MLQVHELVLLSLQNDSGNNYSMYSFTLLRSGCKSWRTSGTELYQHKVLLYVAIGKSAPIVWTTRLLIIALLPCM